MMNGRRRHEEIMRQLDKIEVALVVRDPGTSRSVEAYEGLRKTLVAAAQERTLHLVQLAQFDAALGRTTDVESLRQLVAEWMEQAGLLRSRDSLQRDLFEIVEGKGEELEVLAPAYIDVATRRVVKQGQARAVRASADSQASDETATSGELPLETREPTEQAASAEQGEVGAESRTEEA